MQDRMDTQFKKAVLSKRWYYDGRLVVCENFRNFCFLILEMYKVNCSFKIVLNVLKYREKHI